MKIRFLKDTNIRLNPRQLESDALGVVYEGSVLEMEEKIYRGVAIQDNDKWYRDLNGWYYWSGETEEIQLPQAVANAESGSIDHEPELIVPTISDPKTGLIESIDGSFTRTTARANQESTRLNWALEKYHIPSEWWERAGLTGRGVHIALLSTGATLDHPDLAGAITYTFNSTNSQSPSVDEHGLGTQAAVLIGGRGNIVYGVAPEASLLIGKIGHLDQDITPDNLLKGLAWAIEAGAHIVALLVDFREMTEIQKDNLGYMINKALAKNIILLAPVGNSLERRPEDRFPASLEGVLSVGAHDESGKRSIFSAKSFQLDVLAPGENLITSNIQSDHVVNLKTTAMATAFTAGILALVYQALLKSNRLRSPIEIMEILRYTALSPRSITKGSDVEYGYGLIDPNNLLKQLQQNG